MMISGVMRVLVFAWIFGIAQSAGSPGKGPCREISTETVYVTVNGGKPQTPSEPTISPVVTRQNTESLSGATTPKSHSGKTTAEASTTITETPTDAEFITLETTHTKPGYITTTREGSSDQTVVPVIIPFSGPPIVCFGCFKSFPPSIKIDTSKFCVQLLGSKIGNCPSGDKNDDNNSEDHDDDDNDNDKEEKEEDEEKDDDDDDDEPTSTEKLSSSTTTATSTASTTIPPQYSADILCSLRTCGGGSCRNSQERSLDNSTLDLFKRGDPEQGEWRDPNDYLSREKFISGETHDAVNSLREFSEFVRLSKGPEITTSNYVRFEEKPASLSVTGLFGCTSIIVISRRGAWASHIWEGVFSRREKFEEMSIRRVHKGDGADSVFHPFGIDDLRNQPNAGARGIIFGDNSDPADAPDLHVFIVTPRPRPPQVTGATPEERVWTTDDIRENPKANLGQPPIYQSAIDQIQLDLKNTLGPNVPIKVITYTPRIMSQADAIALYEADMIRKDHDLFGKLMSKITNKLGDSENKSPRGKALIQYRPASDCDDKAKWRIWVEATDAQGQAEWNPSSDQLFEPVEYEDEDDDDDDDDDDDHDYGDEMKAKRMKKRPKACPVKSSDGDNKFTSKATSKPTTTRNGETTSSTTASNPSIKCKKDADCDGPNLRCNSGKRGVCNRHKKCRCQIISKTTRSAPKTTTKELKTKTKDSKTTTMDNQTTMTLSKPTTTAPEPKSKPSKKPLKLGPQHCNDEDDFPNHKDVSGEDVYYLAQDVCNNYDKLVKPNNGMTTSSAGFASQSSINMRASWIEGCVTEVDEQDLKAPGIEKKNRDESPCVTLFNENYQKCYNGGVGGWREFGCVRYYTGAGNA